MAKVVSSLQQSPQLNVSDALTFSWPCELCDEELLTLLTNVMHYAAICTMQQDKSQVARSCCDIAMNKVLPIAISQHLLATGLWLAAPIFYCNGRYRRGRK